jgi:hypothetical protein
MGTSRLMANNGRLNAENRHTVAVDGTSKRPKAISDNHCKHTNAKGGVPSTPSTTVKPRGEQKTHPFQDINTTVFTAHLSTCSRVP